MVGWIAQKYSIVPAFAGVKEKVAPWSIVPESSSPPDFPVTVCAAESSLVQVISCPTSALRVAGANAKPSMATASALPADGAGVVDAAGVDAPAGSGADDPPPPQAARTSAEPTSSAAMSRFMTSP